MRGLLDEKSTVGLGLVRVVYLFRMFRRSSLVGGALIVRSLGRDGLVERDAIEEDATRRERESESVLGETRRSERRADTLEIRLGCRGGV